MDRVDRLEDSSSRDKGPEPHEADHKEASVQEVSPPKAEGKSEVTLEMVMSEISTRNAKISTLKEEMSGANKKIEEFERGVILSNVRLDVLEQELSKLMSRVEVTEETSTILQKRAVRVDA